MKNRIQIYSFLTRSTLALALAGLALLSNAALAQEKGASALVRITRPEAATASQPAATRLLSDAATQEKGATYLVRLNRSQAATVSQPAGPNAASNTEAQAKGGTVLMRLSRP